MSTHKRFDKPAVVRAYLSGAGLTEVAELAGIGRSTAWRWITSDEGQQMIAETEEIRRQSLTEITARLDAIEARAAEPDRHHQLARVIEL